MISTLSNTEINLGPVNVFLRILAMLNTVISFCFALYFVGNNKTLKKQKAISVIATLVIVALLIAGVSELFVKLLSYRYEVTEVLKTYITAFINLLSIIFMYIESINILKKRIKEVKKVE